MRRLLFVVLAVILASGLIVSACGQTEKTTTAPAASVSTPASTPAKTTASTPPTTSTSTPATTSTSPPAQAVQPLYGGTLKIISPQGIKNLGLPPVDIADGLVLRPCVESLVMFGKEGSGSIQPMLATSWEYNSAYTSLTFKLRQGVKFHDGTSFDAEAAKFCMDLVRESPASTYLKSVKSIDVVDTYTVRLNLSAYEPDLLLTLPCAAGAMLSPTAIKKLGNDAKLRPVGTGPFKFASFQRDVNIKYEKFDGYWQKGKPYLDGLEWLFIADTMTGLAYLKSGDAQATKRIEPNDAVNMEKEGAYIVKPLYGPAVGFAGDSAHINSIFSDIRIRQAMAYAVDNQAIAKNVGTGYYLPLNQLAAPQNIGYNPAVKGYPYDPNKAKQLLADAGYPDGFKTKVMIENQATHKLAFTAVQSFFKAVKIELEVDVVDRAKINDARIKGWQNHLMSFLCGLETYKDPGTNLIRYFSTRSSELSPQYVYIPTEYDDKLFKAYYERDPQKRITMFKDVQKVMIDDYCIMNPIYLSTSLFCFSKKVQGSGLGTYGTEWWPEDTWISK